MPLILREWIQKASLETVPEVKQEDSRNKHRQTLLSPRGASTTNTDCCSDSKLLPAPCSTSVGIQSPTSPTSSVQGTGNSSLHPPTACWEQASEKLATYLLLYFPDRLASVRKLPLTLPSLSAPVNHIPVFHIPVRVGFYPKERNYSPFQIQKNPTAVEEPITKLKN